MFAPSGSAGSIGRASIEVEEESRLFVDHSGGDPADSRRDGGHAKCSGFYIDISERFGSTRNHEEVR